MSDKDFKSDARAAIFELVRLRYGHLMDDSQLAEVREGVEIIADVAEDLRAVHLDNGDEPFFVFKPYRGEG